MSCALAYGAYDWPAESQVGGVPSEQRFGDYTVFFSAVRTDTLPPSVLRREALPPPGEHTVLLNVAVRRGDTNLPARVTATVINDADEVSGIGMRETRADEMTAYLGVVHIADPQEFLTFRIEILPRGAAKAFEVRFRRNFVAVPDTTRSASRHGVESLEH